MNCERTQVVLSAGMDGERIPPRQVEAASIHVEGCADCRRFADRSALIRSAVRIRPAEPVPDLVEPIMAAVAVDRVRPTRRRAARSARHRRPAIATPAVAAAIAGLIVGSLLVGGPWQRPEDRPIAAATVVREVRGIAPTLDAFQATYAIHEFGLSPFIPERSLEMDIAFRSPQRFRLEVRDRTRYPSASWTPTDLLYVEDLASTYTSGPSGCPGDLPADVCPRTRATVIRRSAYSAAAPLPADLVVPVGTLASARGIQVLGRDRLDGRDAVRLGLSFDRAEPLFPFLRIGGAWRPFFDRDRVQLWLDASSWIPLRILVTPSASPERRGWELRYGLGVEAAGTTILDVRLTSVSAAPPDPTAFRIPGGPASPTPVELDDVAARLGYVPATPGDPGDLELASVVLPTERSIATPSSLLVYARGLDYLKVGERRDWAGAAPFGPIDEDAQQVSLGGGGVAYYEPAGEGFGRRLAIHGTEADLFLETNLPRERLLEIAASLPVVGRPIPGARSGPGGSEAERVTVDEGIEAAGLPASFPAKLPSGYVVASAELTRSDGEITAVTLLLRQAETDMAGPPLTLHVRPGAGMPPASSSAQVRLVSDGVQARWTPSRSELEWVEPDGYRSLQGDRTLADLLSIARVLVSVSG